MGESFWDAVLQNWEHWLGADRPPGLDYA